MFQFWSNQCWLSFNRPFLSLVVHLRPPTATCLEISCMSNPCSPGRARGEGGCWGGRPESSSILGHRVRRCGSYSCTPSWGWEIGGKPSPRGPCSGRILLNLFRITLHVVIGTSKSLSNYSWMLLLVLLILFRITLYIVIGVRRWGRGRWLPPCSWGLLDYRWLRRGTSPWFPPWWHLASWASWKTSPLL